VKAKKKSTKNHKKDRADYNTRLTHLLKYTYLYLLIRFKLRYRQTSIITHTDFDGAISAAILLQKYPRAKIYYSSPKSLYLTIYAVKKERAPDIPRNIFILDLPYDTTYVTRIVKAIQETRRECPTNVTWIDHHETTTMGTEALQKYVQLHIDPKCPHTAYLVQRVLYERGDLSEAEFHQTNLLLSLLEHPKTEFGSYWLTVLREAVRSVHRCDYMEAVLRSIAQFQKTELTDELVRRHQERQYESPQKRSAIYSTQHGYRFLVFNYIGEGELYPQVRELMRCHQLDFLLVSFQDGTLSAYKNQQSDVNLTPLFTMVCGKGHNYAFHFTPQLRLTDEFFRPLNLPDLLSKVQEVL
jgi:hypothetical protein